MNVDIDMNVGSKRRRLSPPERQSQCWSECTTDQIPGFPQLVDMGYNNPRHSLKIIDYLESTHVKASVEEIRRAFAMVSEFDMHARDEDGWSLLHSVCSDIDLDETTRLNLARVLVTHFWFDPRERIGDSTDMADDAIGFCETHGYDALKEELERCI